MILDCHPTFELYTKIALVAADLCVVPVKLDQNSINGLAFFDEHFQDILDLAPDCEYKVLITLWKPTKANKIGLIDGKQTSVSDIQESDQRLCIRKLFYIQKDAASKVQKYQECMP